MSGSNTKWKRLARRVMAERFGHVMLVTITVPFMNLLAAKAAAWLFPGGNTLSFILGQVFSFAIGLVMCIFSVGMCRVLLRISRGEEYTFGELLYYFSHQPDRVIIASAVMALISFLTSLPAIIYEYQAPAPETNEQLVEIMLISSMLSLAGMILNVILTLPFAMTYYLLADDDEISGAEALKKSAVMMKGHYGRYILLQLSFIPWLLLVLVTAYLIMLWVIPYMEMTNVMFYRELQGEI